MPKTQFIDGTSILTASFCNKIFRDNGGHKHDGVDADGHAGKIELNNEFTVGAHGELAATVDTVGEHKLTHAHASSGVARLVSGIMQAGRGLRVGLSASLSTGAEADGDLQLVAGNGLDPATGVLELARRAGHALLTRSALKVDALRVALAAPPAGMEAAAPLDESLYKGNLPKMVARIRISLTDTGAAPIVQAVEGYNIDAGAAFFSGSPDSGLDHRRLLLSPLQALSWANPTMQVSVETAEGIHIYHAQLQRADMSASLPSWYLNLRRWNGSGWVDAFASAGAGITQVVQIHVCAW